MATVRLSRHVAADPASVALLLAGPALTDADAPVSGDTGTLRMVAQRVGAGVVVAAPRRSGVGFTATIDVTDTAGVTSRGRVSVFPAGDTGCDIDVDVPMAPEAEGSATARETRSFVDRLTRRARQRAFAA